VNTKLQFRDIDKRKEAIIEALYSKANAFADAHLAISGRDIPVAFRNCLNYTPSGGVTVGNDGKETKEDNKTENGEKGEPESVEEEKAVPNEAEETKVTRFLNECCDIESVV